MVALLNAIRCGTDAESRSSLQQLLALCSRQLPEDDEIKPTRLFATNAQVREGPWALRKLGPGEIGP